MNIILLEHHEAADAASVRLDDGRARHIAEVLKVAAGQTIQIGMIDGPLGVGTILSLHHNAVTLHCEFERTVPPAPAVDLLLALPRPKVMKRLWAQLAALGVARVLLVNAARVERQYFDTHVLAPASYRPLLIEGLQQARDTRLPVVSIHRRLKVLIEDELDTLSVEATRLFADPGAARSIAATIGASRPDRCLLAVGPEGGWTDFERDMFRAHGFQDVSMRPRTLRSDTACIALLALVHEALVAS